MNVYDGLVAYSVTLCVHPLTAFVVAVASFTADGSYMCNLYVYGPAIPPMFSIPLNLNVKLMNASNVEVKIIEVELGKPGTIAVVPVVKAEVKATVKPATFGTSVTVTSTQVGATKFQVLDGTNAISAIADLGSSTTVFPGKVAGDKINVKLYNAAGIVVATSEAVLVAGQ